MSINSSEIVWRRAAVMDTSSASNGGRMTATVVPSNVKNNIWPDVPHAERVAGSTKHMKVFVHVANDSNLRLINPRLFVETQTPGDDAVVIFPGTHTDTQSGIAPLRVYGAGRLASSSIAGATSIQVTTEGAALDYFKAGDTIRVSNKTSVDAVAGTTEYATIAGAGVSYAGNVATLTLVAPLANAYSNSNTKVASVYLPGDVYGTYENVSVTSGAGTFTPTDNKLLVGSTGGIYDDWVITFTSVTTFTCVGSVTGGVGSGNRGSDFSPVNSALGRPFFTISSTAWGGTFATGNTVSFRTLPAAVPLWYRRIIPASAGSLSGNLAIVGIDGESE